MEKNKNDPKGCGLHDLPFGSAGGARYREKSMFAIKSPFLALSEGSVPWPPEERPTEPGSMF